MKKNNIYILGIILVVLVVAAYFVNRDTTGEKRTVKVSEKLFAVDSAGIDKLEIERNGKKLVLEKKGGFWSETFPVLYAVNQMDLNNAISALKKYKISSIVSDNPANKNTFGFNDTNVAKLNVYQNGSLAGTILIGSPTSGQLQTYIKKTEGNEIYLAEDFVYNYFIKPDLTDWRDKLIISIPTSSIKSFDVNNNGESYTVKLDTSGKYYIGKDTVSTAVSESIFNMLQNFNTQNFRDTTLSTDVKADYSMKVIWSKETEIKFVRYSDSDNPKKYLLQVSGINQIFEVDDNFVKMLIKSRKEILGNK